MTVRMEVSSAMGLASWRAHCWYSEYTKAQQSAKIITGGPVSPPTIGRPESWGLNEVGVTDAVMTTMWKLGPANVSFAVSSGAESNHFGADIAILDRTGGRLVVYQAKLARLEQKRLRLKSNVEQEHLKLLLCPRNITLESMPESKKKFSIISRLALYQIDCKHYLTSSQSTVRWNMWGEPWFVEELGYETSWRMLPPQERLRTYYNDYVRRGLSSGGVLAARVDASLIDKESQNIKWVDIPKTWPWEFDLYGLLNGGSDLDGSSLDGIENDEPAPPPDLEKWPSDDQTNETEQTAQSDRNETSSEFVYQVSQEIREKLYGSEEEFDNTLLHVIVLNYPPGDGRNVAG